MGDPQLDAPWRYPTQLGIPGCKSESACDRHVKSEGESKLDCKKAEKEEKKEEEKVLPLRPPLASGLVEFCDLTEEGCGEGEESQWSVRRPPKAESVNLD